MATKPAKLAGKPAKSKSVATLRHGDKRKNLPTAEYESLMRQEEKSPIEVAYERRNRDLDPQFVWRGKDDEDWSNLVVPAPPLYIQEKVHPKVLIDDLLRQSKARAKATAPQVNLFADFNGLPKDARATEFYRHDANWTNRMILGDSLQVMASLAEREGLRGKVQCIYVDPPYGIKFNSNFQWSTTSREVKDGNADHITREPEQVKAFRDTWRDGIHSYLTYLRDRLTVARDLLADSGSIFVQIGDENVHRIRAVMDEMFGAENFCASIAFRKTGGFEVTLLQRNFDQVLWYAKSRGSIKFRSAIHMADDLKNTGAGNLFVIFGEPDIDIEPVGKDQVRVRVKGVDVFKPQTGEVVSAGPEGIACWFIDTDYNEESFFVRHAYFLGANDPYQSLKTTLKAEIDQEAWESLHSAVSRPFPKPATGRIAVKVINHLGDEVMKVFLVGAA